MREKPLVISAGQGNWLIDSDGNRWLDAVSSLWTNVHGHCRPELDKALIEQIGRIAHSTLLGLASEPAIRLAERLIRIAPKGLKRVFFSDNGSTSVEAALKMAFQYHQQAPDGDPRRTRVMAFVNAYHGDTIGSVSLGGMDLFHALYRPLLFNATRGEAPYCRVFDWRSRRAYEYAAQHSKGGRAKMKFDFIIGNPPYQEEQEGDNKTFAPPVYHHFIESAYTLAETVELIHPARCLFNAGSTPKAWNEKMLNDPHLYSSYV